MKSLLITITKMNLVIPLFIALFFLPFTNLSGQTIKKWNHSIDSCNKCYCPKYHRTISVDTSTNEKIITLRKQRGKSCNCTNSNPKCEYRSVIKQYYNNGSIHSATVKKGWDKGLEGEYKSQTVFYDMKGKKTKKIIILKKIKKIRKKILIYK